MDVVCPVCGAPVKKNESTCSTCGFKLLGSTQHFEPVQLDEDGIEQMQQEPISAVLHVVRGPQTGVSYRLGEVSLRIGRSPQCDIFLNDMTVSREHARIDPDVDGYVIYDCHSFNGVWVNNENIEQRHLCDGDVIQIGAFCLVYKQS